MNTELLQLKQVIEQLSPISDEAWQEMASLCLSINT